LLIKNLREKKKEASFFNPEQLPKLVLGKVRCLEEQGFGHVHKYWPHLLHGILHCAPNLSHVVINWTIFIVVVVAHFYHWYLL
jgi:hypothetical protein